jgi:hypothetical protein
MKASFQADPVSGQYGIAYHCDQASKSMLGLPTVVLWIATEMALVDRCLAALSADFHPHGRSFPLLDELRSVSSAISGI